MKVTSSYTGISRQIIIIVLMIMAFVTVGLSVVIGVTSFNNLATLTLDELDRTSKILSSQLHELERNAVKSIVDIEGNTLLQNGFEQLTNLGPYYFSDESQKDRDIDESDKIYTLQSQIEIVQALRSFQNIYQLSSISFYYLSPFDQFEKTSPVLSLRMDMDGFIVGQFKTKGQLENRTYHHVGYSNYDPPSQDFFNVSSVYELTVHDFYSKMNFTIAATIGIDEIYSGFEIDDARGDDRIKSFLIINDGIPVIRTLAPVFVPVSNPDTWEAERVPAMLMVIDQTIDGSMLIRLRNQLGIDVALAKDNVVLVSSLPKNENFSQLMQDQTVSSSVQNFYYSWQQIEFGERDDAIFKAVVLSPISILATLTKGLFLQMSLLVSLATVLSAVAIFVAIRRLVNRPLNQLMDGVEKISSGDLTYRVKVRSQNELGELASEFNLMSDKLAKKSDELQKKIEALKEMDKLKDSFLANTSHELRTPLNGIIGIADSMIDGATGEVSEVQLVNLSMIVSSGRRLSSLVDDILDFSKMRHHDLQLMLTPVDIKIVTNIVLKLSKTLVKQKDLKLIEVIENDLPLVDADENRLQQILYNLVGNALKFTNSGYVSISAYLAGNKMEISVTDSGIGIPLEKQKNIFDSFSQAEDSISREYGGTGLGLAVTKQLVELHGGEIWIKSTPGFGSAFFFTLPLSTTKRGDLKKSSPSALKEGVRIGSHIIVPDVEPAELTLRDSDTKEMLAPNDEGGKKGEGITVLVVDDEPVNLQVISNHLSLHQYTVIEAINGPDALSIIREGNKVDLILLDVMMPKMSGFEVCQKLREEYSPLELPIILVTAKNQATDLVEGFSSGANDYLTKPFSKYELLARIDLHIQLTFSSKEIIEKEIMLKKYTTNLKLTNDELKQYQSSLEIMVEKRTLKLKDAQKQLIESEKMASLGELVAGVAHEINTPVGVGVTAASFLSDETKIIDKKYTDELMTREDFSEYLTCSLQTTEMILSNLQRATELIKSFKKVAVDQTAEDKRCFFVTSYIGEVLRTLHPRIKKTKHNIEVLSGKDIEINSYPGTFSQIITNLVMNSIIHAFDEDEGEGGNVVIDIKPKDEGIIISFSDDGKGVGKDDISKVFDPFYTTKRGRGGTGLGLHIVYNLVTQKLKGNIKCESDLGKGTVFYIYIPSIVE